jgi:peroxiredoxin
MNINTFAVLFKKNLYIIFLHMAVVGLAAEVFVLSAQNKKLKGSGNLSVFEALKVGDPFHLPALKAVQGNAVIHNEGRKLVFLFTTTCPWCKENIQNWKIIHEVARTKNIEILGISLDDQEKSASYSTLNRLTYPVFTTDNREDFKKENQISIIPLTVLISPLGKVEGTWIGLLEGNHMQEIVNTISKTNP